MDIRKTAIQRRYRTRDGSVGHRLLTMIVDRHLWYDWGHRVMILFGQYRTGSYEAPRGRDLWYRFENDNETHGRIITTHAYADVRANPNLAWKILDVQDEGGTVMMGWYGDRITFYGLSRREMKLFRRWDFWECRARAEWFGLRRWAYYKGLHAAVHLKKPFTCQAVPPRGSGGYSHWYCELRGKHTEHRYRAYTWTGVSVKHNPAPVHTDGSK